MTPLLIHWTLNSQMASIFNLLFLTLFFALVFKAYGDCALSQIGVRQYKTSDYAHGMPVLKVNVTNNCECTQSQVKFNCTDFQTYLSIDPAIFSDDCLLIQGGPFYPSQSAIFYYAWDPKFTFTPISSQTSCS
ncbi:uncharacterized protein LOC127128714 [Lathyrus oleraceus]|nr:uncharacterized protein LOC127128714 [Pisum sativum]